MGVPAISEYRLPVLSERRDPTAATQPTGYQSPGQPMVPVWDAWQAFQYGYLANTFVYACVKAIAEDLSRLPIRVGDPSTGEFDVKHPLAVHLGPPPGGPNPATAARKLIAWSVVQWLVTGRIGWEIEAGSSGRPLAYWPLPGTHLRPIPSQGGVSYFAGYEYGRGTDPKRLPAESVFYTWDPSPDDWRQAESRLQAMRLDISVAVMQDRYDYAFLKNDSRPAAIVVHEAFAAREERDAWRRQFRGQHEGPDNAGRIAFAESEGGDAGVGGSLDVKVLGFSQKDSQAIQRYEAKLRAITVGLGVPLSRLGDASGRTFSNADAEGTFYWRNTILPKALDLADAFTMQLLPRYSSTGGVVYFDTSGVEALQEGGKVADVQPADLVSAGAATKNELRKLAGLPPVSEPGFDDYAEPKPPPAPVVVQPPQLQAVPDPAQDPDQADEPARSRRPFDLRAPIEGPGGDEVRATNLWRSADAQVTLLERVWQRELRTLFAKQERAVLARLRGKRGRQMLTRAGTDVVLGGSFSGLGRELFDPGFWTASTADILSGLYAQVFGAAGARVSDEFGISFDLLQEGVDEQIQQRANQLAGTVTETTFRQLQDQLTDGVIAGDSIDVLADRVQLVFAAADERRARTIARTEVIGSFNGAQVQQARNLPADVVGGMEWISTRDARTRAEHRGRWPGGPDGQVVPITDAFLVGGEHLHYPGDPAGSAGNVINCRCTVAFLDPDEFRKRYTDQQTTSEVAPTVAEDQRPPQTTTLGSQMQQLSGQSFGHVTDDWGVTTETDAHRDAAKQAREALGTTTSREAVKAWSLGSPDWIRKPWAQYVKGAKVTRPRGAPKWWNPDDVGGLLETLTHHEVTDPLYRGLNRATMNPAGRAAIDALTPGDRIDGTPASWSRDRDVARIFGTFGRGKDDPISKAVILELEAGSHGMDVAASGLEMYAWQAEVIAGDPILEVVNVERDDAGDVIRVLLRAIAP